MNPDELMDRLEGDTWGWNRWYDLMCRLLRYKESGWDEAKENYLPAEWPDTVTWDAEELRDLIKEMEAAWLHQVRTMYEHYARAIQQEDILCKECHYPLLSEWKMCPICSLGNYEHKKK